MNLSEWWFRAIKRWMTMVPEYKYLTTCTMSACAALASHSQQHCSLCRQRHIIPAYPTICRHDNPCIHTHTLTPWYSHVQEAWLRKRDRRQTQLKKMCFLHPAYRRHVRQTGGDGMEDQFRQMDQYVGMIFLPWSLSKTFWLSTNGEAKFSVGKMEFRKVFWPVTVLSESSCENLVLYSCPYWQPVKDEQVT